MKKFYYDESEHSRKINEKTITQGNYYDNFVSTIVGWDEYLENEVIKKYELFEDKFSERKSNDELKSTTIKAKQLKNGFASLTHNNLDFVEDFLAIFDDKIYLYFSVISKIEYIVNQLFQGYENNLFQDADALRYTIVKSIVVYQPEKIINGIYTNTLELANLIKDFYKHRIELNVKNPELKAIETEAFEQAIVLLDSIENNFKIDWSYHIAFFGFQKYLEENNFKDISLFLDKEGDESRTLLAAKEVGIENVFEVDSKASIGVRIADMLVGIIGKLLKAIHESKKYISADDTLNKKLLDQAWFVLNNKQFNLYKKMKYIISELNNSWYKSFAGVYSDDLLALVTLINYFASFDDISDFNKYTPREHQERVNSTMIARLEEHFQTIHSKLPVTPFPSTDEDYFYNQRGAKVYYDEGKQPILDIKEGSQSYLVLNVGFLKESTPTVTIQKQDDAICYRLPEQLAEWTMSCVAFANMGENLFPSKVIFSKKGDKYFADII